MKSKSIFRSRLLMTIFLTALGFVANAQYGGYASVWVRDTDNKTRQINVVFETYEYETNSESQVKSKLENQLKTELNYNESFSGTPYYKTFLLDGKKMYRHGRGSVQVKKPSGYTRIITVNSEEMSFLENKNDLAKRILQDIEYEMESEEFFISPIDFELN